MKALLFVLWQFIVAIITESQFLFQNQTTHNRYKRNSPPEELFLRINNNQQEIFIIHLKRTDQLLANLHLPIWSVRKIANKPKFHKEREVMNEISEFTMYHDYLTKSAIVYFHKTGLLDGIIDVRYYIHGLPISEMTQTLTVNDKYVFDRKKSTEYSQNPDTMSNRIPQGDSEMLARKSTCTIDRQLVNELSRSSSNILYYPELLVVIGYDVFDSFKNKKERIEELRNMLVGKYNELGLSAVVSYVLTFYNAADMLFGLMESYKIKLNIAAIVIEVDQGAIDFLETPLQIRTPLNDVLLANPVLINLMTGFEKLDDKFPADSYDFIIYTTTYQLTKVSPGLNKKTLYYRGFTCSNLEKHPDQVHNFKHTSIIIRDDLQFKYFITFAHELAHAMAVGHDPAKSTANNKCDSFIMTSGIDRCPRCLRWSEKTKEFLGNYFRSPAHCILKNFPRSLSPPGPRMTLTRKEQYQCFDFPLSCESEKTKRKHRSTFLHGHVDVKNGCKKIFRCWDDADMEYTFKLMDGTPCGRNKVCWNKNCVKAMN